MRMRWASLAFLHWPADASIIRTMVPQPLEIDTFDGSAWIGLVPFTMPLVKHRLFGSIPTMARFHECNVRSYVRYGRERGVWFHSLDATSRLAVAGARLRWRLNYRRAAIELAEAGSTIDYRVRRLDHCTHVHLDQPGVNLKERTPMLDCSWTLGEALPPSEPGSFEQFLTERYALFTLDGCVPGASITSHGRCGPPR